MKTVSTEIKLDLANYISRQHYSLNDNLETRTKRWLREKHKISVSAQEAENIVKYYQEIYTFIKNNLSKCIRPSSTGFADPEFIDENLLKKNIFSKYRRENKKVLRKVMGWVIYYEYLR